MPHHKMKKKNNIEIEISKRNFLCIREFVQVTRSQCLSWNTRKQTWKKKIDQFWTEEKNLKIGKFCIYCWVIMKWSYKTGKKIFLKSCSGFKNCRKNIIYCDLYSSLSSEDIKEKDLWNIAGLSFFSLKKCWHCSCSSESSKP